MPPLMHRYKRAERLIFTRISAALVRAAGRIKEAWKRFARGGSQGLSILVVSHSEETPRGVRITFFGLAGICLLCAAMIISVFAFSGSLGGAATKASASSAELTQAQEELDAVKAQAGLLKDAFKDFQSALDPILAAGGELALNQAAAKPVASFLFAKRKTDAQTLAEMGDSLDKAAPLIAEYGAMLGQMDSVKETVPAIWPISGAVGHISTTFGTNPNPFTGQSYFHTGIDCSTYRSGDTLVATADGKVIFAGVEGGYGRCVIIAHAYGYITRMGHMDRILVRIGQTVKQGQPIGILGNSGVSTAPHTHYEVIMGRGYLDPTDFLWSGSHSFPIVTGGGQAD
jgi:murein DD-endopeptidase MepM/ murein hydrolase activator NlpD